jgi:hypothetical protein
MGKGRCDALRLPVLSRWQGVGAIVRFNWPFYVAVVVLNLGILALLEFMTEALLMLAMTTLVIADIWTLASLVVSHWIYDRSPISRGAWLDDLQPRSDLRVLTIDAGHDEAGPMLRAKLPEAPFRRLDIHRPGKVGSPSLERPRSESVAAGESAAFEALPVTDGSMDLVLGVFAWHEVRDSADRIAFLREIRRILSDRGRVVVVEHLRDFANFAAYGPGALHFLSRSSWLEGFRVAGLEMRSERKVTPWITIYTLGKEGPR